MPRPSESLVRLLNQSSRSTNLHLPVDHNLSSTLAHYDLLPSTLGSILAPQFPGSNMEDPPSEPLVPSCTYTPPDRMLARFILVLILTGSLCCLGLLGNLASIYVLTRRRMQSTGNWLLVLLACFDLGVVTGTLLVSVLEIAFDYFQSYELYAFWFSYTRELTLISNICQVGAVYSTLAATAERWVYLTYPKLHSTYFRNSVIVATVAAVILFVVTGLQLPRFFETEIVLVDHRCTDFGRFSLTATKLLQNRLYVMIYSIWFCNTFFVFIPFVTLLVLNVAIFFKATRKKNEVSSTMLSLSPWVKRIEDRIHKRRTKQATMVLLVVVLVFLVCNLPALILALLESFFNLPPIAQAYAKDAIGTLTVINSSANFIIYVVFGRDFRQELFRIPKNIRRRLGLETQHRRARAIYRPRARFRRTRMRRSLETVTRIGFKLSLPPANKLRDARQHARTRSGRTDRQTDGRHVRTRSATHVQTEGGRHLRSRSARADGQTDKRIDGRQLVRQKVSLPAQPFRNEALERLFLETPPVDGGGRHLLLRRAFRTLSLVSRSSTNSFDSSASLENDRAPV